jgi:hypothetical protein
MFSVSNIMVIMAVLMTVIQLGEQVLGPGTGPEKKAAVIEAVKKLIDQLKIQLPAFVTDNLGVFVDMFVALYNLFGPFAKKPTA